MYGGMAVPVSYLGSDLSPQLLAPALTDLRAGLVLIYTDRPDNAQRLIGFTVPTNNQGHEIRGAFAGHAAQIEPELTKQIVLEYLGADLREVVWGLLDRLR